MGGYIAYIGIPPFIFLLLTRAFTSEPKLYDTLTNNLFSLIFFLSPQKKYILRGKSIDKYMYNATPFLKNAQNHIQPVRLALNPK